MSKMLIFSFSLKYIFGIVGIFATIIGFGQYAISIWQGKTKPHTFTWVIWSVATLSVFLAQFVNGGGAGSWSTGFSAFMITLIAISCYLTKQDLKIDLIDKSCLILSFVALIFWHKTSNALQAVIIFTVIDLIGYIPSAKKAYNRPFEENLFGFGMSSFRNITSLLAIEKYCIITTLFQASIITANTAFILMVIYRRSVKNLSNSSIKKY